MAAPGAAWRVAHPVNGLAGPEAAAAGAYLPLKAAFPDLERRDTIFVGGAYEGRRYLAAVGHYCGTFRADWLGIPADAFDTLYWGCVPGPLEDTWRRHGRSIPRDVQAAAFCNYLDTLNNQN